MTRATRSKIWILLLWLIWSGCGEGTLETAPTGSVEVAIHWSSTLSGKPEEAAGRKKILNAAQSIQIMMTGPQIPSSIIQCTSRAAGAPSQTITIQNIPAGNTTFSLTLFSQSACQGRKVDETAASLNVLANQTNPLTVTFTGQRVFTVEVTQATGPILIGAQTVFSAIAKNADGEILSGKSVSWLSSRPDVAAIDPATGQARGLAGGSTIVTALIEGESGTASLSVNAAAPPLCTVSGAPPPIPAIGLQLVASGLVSPVHITHAGDGSDRLFIVEQIGTVRVWIGGAIQTFLDIRDRVRVGEEMGLLSLAFHPNYSANGLFYVNYSTERLLNGSQDRRSVISEFKVGATPNETASSERILLTILHPHPFHHGGQLAFGPEPQPYLYFSMGDGAEDPSNAQRLTNLLGKVLRIDVDRKEPGLEYAVPPDNPAWSGVSGARREIWAYGFRNPWRFSFDPVTGFQYLADVGQSAVEEIDIVRKGLNYGWDQVEGNICFRSGCNLDAFTPPLFVHPRTEFQAIIGGHVYRGSQIPNLCGVYVYGDFATGKIRGLRTDGTSVTSRDLAVLPNLTTFGKDESHELYAVNYLAGTLFKIVP